MAYELLKAIVISNEFNLERIAKVVGINKKYKWEDTLVLSGPVLGGVVRETEGKYVRLFHFGSLVFSNCSSGEIMEMVGFLKQIDKSVNAVNPFEYAEDYRIEVDTGAYQVIGNDCMTVPGAEPFYSEIVAIVLAKSVALDRIETRIDRLLDDVEEIVDNLHLGRLTVSDEHLARLSAKILGFKLDTLSYIRLADKPGITWSSDEAAKLYDKLSVVFELNERYSSVRYKLDTLLGITEVFGGLVHAKRGTKLEWAIIILILVEIILQVGEKLL
jgi:required for meiotic nuclear division protein 1